MELLKRLVEVLKRLVELLKRLMEVLKRLMEVLRRLVELFEWLIAAVSDDLRVQIKYAVARHRPRCASASC